MSQETAVSHDITTGLRSPVRVAVVDIAEPLVDLDCTRSKEPPYTAAWILACKAGHPLGVVVIPLRGTLITAGQLEQELRRHFGTVSALAPRKNTAKNTAPLARVSVVVPCNFARPEGLQRCVARLTLLDYPDYEVIVVDNRPGDVPPVEVPGARVVREPHPGISAARNRGIAAATGEIIAFTDDDVVVDRGWLRALGERFGHEPDVAAVTGLAIPLELETSAQVLFEQSGYGLDRNFVPLTFERAGLSRIMRRTSTSSTGQIRSLYETGEFGIGSNMAYRTAMLRETKGFDEALGVGTPTCGGEDLAMLVELLASGQKIAYEPDAIIQHRHRATYAELERQLHGYGIGFTAMLTAIALRDPRHVLGLASVVPRWLRSLRDPTSAKQVHRTEDYPPSLERAEFRGMLGGPFVYLRSRWIQRRWQMFGRR